MSASLQVGPQPARIGGAQKCGLGREACTFCTRQPAEGKRSEAANFPSGCRSRSRRLWRCFWAGGECAGGRCDADFCCEAHWENASLIFLLAPTAEGICLQDHACASSPTKFPEASKSGAFLTQSILLDHNLLALAARKSAASAGGPALFARASW